jgi:hypothetical protein
MEKKLKKMKKKVEGAGWELKSEVKLQKQANSSSR